MKKSLLLASLMLLPIAALAKSPTPANEPAPLPTGVSVAPSQGFVDISGSNYPLGVSSIGITFGGKEIVINENCTTPAELYYNDFSTPYVTTLSRSVDAQTWSTAGVIFKGGTYKNNGVYKIVIPEGMFCYASGTDSNGDPTGTEPTPGMTLYYEIYVGYQVIPAPGVVSELEDIRLVFADADEVIANNGANSVSFYKDNAAGDYSVIQEVADLNNDGIKNTVVFRIDQDGIAATFSESGVFGLNIPAGAYTYRIYGPNHATDPTDYVEYTTDEILVKYNIPKIPQPEIWPYTDETVEEFEYFELTMPDNFTKWFQNDRTYSNLYGVTDNGVVDTTYPYVRAMVTDYEDCTETMIVLHLIDATTLEPLDSYTPPRSGLYCFRLGESLFSGEYQSLIQGASPEFITSDPFDYYYEVKVQGGSSSVIDIEEAAKADTVTVYTFTGIRVALDADPAVLGGLAPGLYIVNGKKMLKK